MESEERLAFVNGYTQLLAGAWSSRTFARKLDQDPRAALATYGLTVPDDAQVVVRRQPTLAGSGPTLEVQMELWEKGRQTGVYEVIVPQTAGGIPNAELTTADLVEPDRTSKADLVS